MPINAALLRTPPRLDDTGIRETPRPVKARIAELEKQNNILLGQKHALERKHQAELSKLQSEIITLTTTSSTSSLAFQRCQAEATSVKQLCDKYEIALQQTRTELRRAEEDVRKGKAFGEGMFRERMRMAENEKAEMRNEFDLQVRLVEHRAALKLAKVETVMIDMERKALQSDQDRLGLQHRLSKANARMADLEDEAKSAAVLSREMDKMRSTLKTMTNKYKSATEALEGLKQAQSSTETESQSKLVEARTTVSDLQTQLVEIKRESTADKKAIAKHERTIKSLQERESQLEKEVEDLSSEEKAKGGESDKQVKAMRIELKGIKGDLRSKEEEVKELEEELENIRKDAREKEKSSKREGRENEDLKDKVAGLEEEIDSLRRNNAALVEKAKKYRSEARAAGATQPKERERSASVEPVKRKAPAPVEAVQEPMEEEGEEEEPAEVPKPGKKAKRETVAAPPKKASKSQIEYKSDDEDEEEDEEEVYKPKARTGRASRSSARATAPAQDSASDEEPVVKKSKTAPITQAPAAKKPAPKIRAMSSFEKTRLQPTIMEEDENDENSVESIDHGKRKNNVPAVAEGEKKKKRKLGAIAPLAPAFDFNGFLTGASSGNSLIPSILSPMKPTGSSLQRNSLSMSRSFGSSVSSSRKMFGTNGRM